MKSDIGLGILSWRSYDTLVRVLDSLVNFSENFGERLIYFNELDDECRRICSDYGYACSGTVENLGIYGGFRGLSESMNSRYVLLLENDWHLVESDSVGLDQLRSSYNLLSSGRADIVSLRHIRVGVDMMKSYTNYLRYYPIDSSFTSFISSSLRHILRPSKARFNIGGCVYVLDSPHLVHSEVILDDSTGFYLLPCFVRGWSNHPFMLERDFFISEILSRVESAPTTKRVNGHKNMENELDRVWWSSRPWTIGISSPGLFHHHRVGYRGY